MIKEERLEISALSILFVDEIDSVELEFRQYLDRILEKGKIHGIYSIFITKSNRYFTKKFDRKIEILKQTREQGSINDQEHYIFQIKWNQELNINRRSLNYK